jgi:ubiquitin carboxyl-terminal hydrolase 4/11/15
MSVLVHPREKVNDLIDFPIEGLDLNAYVKSSQSANEQTPAIYDLYGVSEHSGGMGGGHYTAKCRNDFNGKWYCFNDSHVTECTAQSAISSEAYVLFYKRR